MGVIRWEVTEYQSGIVWIGYLGDLAVCDVTSEHNDGTVNLLLYPTYPWPESEGGKPFLSASYERVACFDDGKAVAEGPLQEWLAKAGLVATAELDDANEAYSGLHKEFLSRIDQALDLAKDLRWSQLKVDRLKRENKALREEMADIKSTAEFSRQCYSNLHQKHVELGNDYLELLRAVGKIKKIAGEVA